MRPWKRPDHPGTTWSRIYDAERGAGRSFGIEGETSMSSNLDKLRGVLGIVGGRESEVLGIAIKRLKEQEAEIDRLNDLLAERGEQTEGDKT